MKLLERFKRKDEECDRPDFTGKILVVYRLLEERVGMFQDARLVKLGFCDFLVGRRVELEPSLNLRWSGAVFWIATHNISQMIVFDDLESARRALGDQHA